MTTENTTTCTRCSRPVADGAYCCAACVAQTRDNLEFIAEMHSELDVTLTRQDRLGEGGGGRASAETPLPLNLHASDVGHRLRNTLTTWARIVIEERGAEAPEDDLAAVAMFLRQRAGWIAHREWGPESFDNLGRVAVDLGHAVDSPSVMVSLGRCDTDGCETELRTRKAADWTSCRACGTSYDVERRKRDLLGRIEGLCEPAPFIATVLTTWMGAELPVTTIRTWAHRGQLRVRSTDPATRQPRYRIGDVKALHLKAITAKARKAVDQAPDEQNAQHQDGTLDKLTTL